MPDLDKVLLLPKIKYVQYFRKQCSAREKDIKTKNTWNKEHVKQQLSYESNAWEPGKYPLFVHLLSPHVLFADKWNLLNVSCWCLHLAQLVHQ